MSADTQNSIAHEIADLDHLTLETLHLRWQTKFGRSAPTQLSKGWLARLFAYRLQAEYFGDLTPSTVSLLDRLGKENQTDRKPIPLLAAFNGRDQLKAGTVLMREHAGVSHHVMATPEGYSWNGQSFSSLSQVATAITGTKWNGPRFFGLKSRKAAS